MVFPGGLMRLLFIASEPMEYTGILAHSADPKPAKVAVHWARFVRLGGQEAMLVANGAGPTRAAMAVGAASAVFQPDALISTGFCGALDPELSVAEVVVGQSVDNGQRRWPLQPVASNAPHRSGVICSIDHVAQTGAEKASLRYSSGAAVVEMEAAGVAKRVEPMGLPMYCVRVVTDLADEDMANDFSKALRPDGHFDTMLVLRNALRHPWARVPELMRLRQRCARAAQVLGDFIADCRF
jgi:adenosylhomocysteine nucleosidase